MSNNMRDRFVCSNFDEIDIVLDTDRRFDEAIAAADKGEEDLVDAIVKEISEACKKEACGKNEGCGKSDCDDDKYDDEDDDDDYDDDDEDDDDDDEECDKKKCSVKENDVIEYNPEDDDAIGILDSTAEDYREYVSGEEYGDDDGEIIDSVMDGEIYD